MEENFEPLENFAVISEVSYASPYDIAQYRGVPVEPDYPVRGLADEDEDPRSNRVDSATLRPDYAIGRGGGSRNKGRKKSVKPLTGPERARRAEAALNRQVLPETPVQRAHRHFLAAIEEMEKVTSIGRPRKGKELRVFVSGTSAPATLALIKREGLTVGEALDGLASELEAA